MEENVLIRSIYHKGRFKKWYKILAILALCFFISTMLYNFVSSKIIYNRIIENLGDSRWQYDSETHRDRYFIRTEKHYVLVYENGEYRYDYEDIPIYTDSFDRLLDKYEYGKYSSHRKYFKQNGGILFYHPFGIVLFCVSMSCILTIIVTLIIQLILSKCRVTVTDKNVTGKALWGKQVVLPIHMIAAYSTRQLFSKIAITTTSGVIKFGLIKNYKEIGEVLSTLINQRQENTEVAQATPIITQQPTGNLDELKKLKELLDMGIISQEEFDVKKKQLLGL